MNPNLTSGILKNIMQGETSSKPILQVLQSKKITSGKSGDRYRLLLSDGQYQITQAMLTGNANLDNFCIVQLNHYQTNNITSFDNKVNRVLLILSMDVLVKGSQVEHKIGNPQPLTEFKNEMPSTLPSSSSSVPKETIRAEPSSDAMNESLSDSRIISLISTLTPYHNKWVIKARVSNKSNMRTWSNSKGEGKLFSVDLIDESGEIRCTAFRDLADKYYNYLQVDKIYYISKCQLKQANKQFNTLKNDYEMTIGNESVIEECTSDDGVVPQVQYAFIPLSDIVNRNVGDVIDVIGVCKETSDVVSLTSRTTNRELKKRDVILVDQSNASITLTLWGAQAENFEGSNNPVVVVRGSKVGEFGGGKTLSTLMSSQMKINPDIVECHRIKGWYDSEGCKADMKNLSERSTGGLQTQWINLKEVQEKNLGHSDRGDYFQVVATILLVRSENSIYKACPTDGCNKKVLDLENGMYRCERCKNEFPNFKYRLLVSMNIADFSANNWVSVFSGEAEKILGKTAQEVGLLMEEGSEAAAAVFQEANFKQFIFKCRAKMESYNDEQRMKIVVVNVDPIDYEKHNTYMIKQLEEMMASSVH